MRSKTSNYMRPSTATTRTLRKINKTALRIVENRILFVLSGWSLLMGVLCLVDILGL